MTGGPVASRPTPIPFRLGHRPALDGLRGYALVIVILFHAQIPWVHLGHAGLILFFVLSGFLITVLMLQEWQATGAIDMKEFYRRRALRIVPALVLFSVAAGTYVQVVASPQSARDQWWSVASTLAFVSNWVEVLTDHPLLLVEHTWSVAVEVQFYLVFPLLLWVALRRGVSWRKIVGVTVAVVVAVVVVRGFWWHYKWGLDRRLLGRIHAGTDMRLDQLLIGCLLGMAAFHGKLEWFRQRPRFTSWAAVASMIWITYFATHGVHRQVQFGGASTLVAIAGALVIIAGIVVEDAPVTRLLSSRLLVWFGTVSYAVYLWHVPIYRILREKAPGLSLGESTVVGAALAFALASISYYGVERWFLKRKRPRAGSKASAPAPSPASSRTSEAEA